MARTISVDSKDLSDAQTRGESGGESKGNECKDAMIVGEGYLKKNPGVANEQDLLQILKNAYRG